MSTMHVFVYGTLKRGQPNHHWMTSERPEHGRASLVGVARTVRPFPLVVAGPWNIPYCVDRPGEGHNITGEVYRIDAEKLRHLDVLETYPTHYNRRLEEVTLLDAPDATPLSAWVYLWEKYTEDHLQLPFLENYANDAASERRYVPKDQRTLQTTC
ncbi:putative gamma-glutamylcyclotransferase CG2811 [Pollicipes pollicipes]|uniref:putative gamma-glutamylcyclotransferase CG2811 n=1 Tax=Pollicipes pollicipes TaxID=41117 RepID=UPI0018852034|nr:putative gamma-glutamylcyclotransferase CG2811 [Pollicipes pollicipes]XP_037074281.1 putative gamma-glutamylcyclotransferase CG2811 [Pollicipes pollicipes]XP_037074282.1 putative gamma-glutamylcyclotransferase CG2811 [Pollicipes pollicipes]